jgi:hypothetical protein
LKTIEGKTTECFYISTTPPEDIPDAEDVLSEEEEGKLPF